MQHNITDLIYTLHKYRKINAYDNIKHIIVFNADSYVEKKSETFFIHDIFELFIQGGFALQSQCLRFQRG